MRVYFDQRFASWTTGDEDADQPLRVHAAMAGLDGVPFELGSFAPATVAQLARVHVPGFQDDLPPRGVQAGLLLAGACLAAAEDLASGHGAYVLGRPPGHLAGPALRRGRALVNGAALAADRLTRLGARVAVVDLDAHHGLGTQEVFYARPDVLFLSLHREAPFFPGTGGTDERGEGPGEGTTVNIPLHAGAEDPVILEAWQGAALPALRHFAPDALVISAGFDALRNDAGGLCLSPGALARMWGDCVRTARCMAVLEDGYDPVGLEEGVRFTAEVLAAR